jgi:hypothetical protein
METGTSPAIGSSDSKALYDSSQPNQNRWMRQRPAFRNQEDGSFLVAANTSSMISVITQLGDRACMNGYQA